MAKATLGDLFSKKELNMMWALFEAYPETRISELTVEQLKAISVFLLPTNGRILNSICLTAYAIEKLTDMCIHKNLEIFD